MVEADALENNETVELPSINIGLLPVAVKVGASLATDVEMLTIAASLVNARAF